MTAGTLAMACFMLALGQGPPAEPYYSNQRAHNVPVNFDGASRGQLERLVLYASDDQGRVWRQAAAITPDKDAFAFYAPKDGAYWLIVAALTHQGRQVPE